LFKENLDNPSEDSKDIITRIFDDVNKRFAQRGELRSYQEIQTEIILDNIARIFDKILKSGNERW